MYGPRRRRSPSSRAAPSLSTTSRARRTTSVRSTGTSIRPGSRTCCQEWRRRSSTSAHRRTRCSTGATCSTTARTFSRAVRRRASNSSCGPARASCARSPRTPSGPRAPA
jgi:hypothetical protein